MRVTAKMIAQELGLSISTVDRAFNQRGNVRKETYERIMNKAKELNYTRNQSASFLSRRNQVSIGVIFPVYPQDFWSQVEIGINRAKFELQDYGLVVTVYRMDYYSTENRSDLIKETLQTIIENNKHDALIISSNDTSTYETTIYESLIDQGIMKGLPICTLNNDSPASKRLFYVGCDYRKTGRLAADLFTKMLRSPAKIALLTHLSSPLQQQQKIIGFREVMAEWPHLEIVGPLKFTPFSIHKSLDKHKDELEHVHGIYVVNAELGNVAEYIEKQNFSYHIHIIGQDMTQQVYEYLQCNIITAVICQEPNTQGYLAVKKMFDYLTGRNTTNKMDNITKLELAFKENAKYFI